MYLKNYEKGRDCFTTKYYDGERGSEDGVENALGFRLG